MPHKHTKLKQSGITQSILPTTHIVLKAKQAIQIFQPDNSSPSPTHLAIIKSRCMAKYCGQRFLRSNATHPKPLRLAGTPKAAPSKKYSILHQAPETRPSAYQPTNTLSAATYAASRTAPHPKTRQTTQSRITTEKNHYACRAMIPQKRQNAANHRCSPAHRQHTVYQYKTTSPAATKIPIQTAAYGRI